MKNKNQKPTKMQWVKMSVVCLLYIAFLVWIKSWWGVIVLPFIFDAYITKKIPWTWWKEAENPVTRTVMSWVDAIVFALVAVYFVNIYFFQNYTIPTSSLEKSLLVGDYLFVSKMSYGPRVPQTPLSMPLTQHTMPILGTKSYSEWPQWEYKRVKGGKVQLNDIVVFNYPAGDTVSLNPAYQPVYYRLCYGYGRQIYDQMIAPVPVLDSLSVLEQRNYLLHFYELGRQYVAQNVPEFGEVTWRPVDRRENYVKRCVGLPGQTLQIKDHVVYLDGKPNKEPQNVQYNYRISLKNSIPDELVRQLGLSQEDLQGAVARGGVMPLTNEAYQELSKRKDIVEHISYESANDTEGIYPWNQITGWTADNYGPVWIPAKGKSIELTAENIAVYERPIRVYEGNDLQIKSDGRIYINGKQATSYTFKMDYYWMMGDNRHNSEDSRYWGFVPEDHIVGKPILIWLSLDKDRGWFDGHIRWNRIFRLVDNIK